MLNMKMPEVRHIGIRNNILSNEDFKRLIKEGTLQ